MWIASTVTFLSTRKEHRFRQGEQPQSVSESLVRLLSSSCCRGCCDRHSWKAGTRCRKICRCKGRWKPGCSPCAHHTSRSRRRRSTASVPAVIRRWAEEGPRSWWCWRFPWLAGSAPPPRAATGWTTPSPSAVKCRTPRCTLLPRSTHAWSSRRRSCLAEESSLSHPAKWKPRIEMFIRRLLKQKNLDRVVASLAMVGGWYGEINYRHEWSSASVVTVARIVALARVRSGSHTSAWIVRIRDDSSHAPSHAPSSVVDHPHWLWLAIKQLWTENNQTKISEFHA